MPFYFKIVVSVVPTFSHTGFKPAKVTIKPIAATFANIHDND